MWSDVLTDNEITRGKKIFTATLQIAQIPKEQFLAPGCNDSTYTILRRVCLWLIIKACPNYQHGSYLVRHVLGTSIATLGQRYAIADAQIDIHKNPKYIELIEQIEARL